MADDRRHGFGPVGFADLFTGLADIEEDDERELVARSLGFVARPDEPQTSRDPPPDQPAASTTTPAEPLGPRRAQPIRFWRAYAAEYELAFDGQLQPELPPPEPANVISIEDLGREIGRDERLMAKVGTPPWPEIAAWSRLRRPMENIHRALRHGGMIDIDAVVDGCSRGEALSRVPRRLRRVRRSRLVILLDRSWRLLPFRHDMDRVRRRLRGEFGRGVETVRWRAGPPSWKGPNGAMAIVGRGLRSGDGVLVIGDLGYLETGQQRTRLMQRWQALGRDLDKAGVGCAALVPCPRARWALRTPEHWTCVDWERPSPSFRARRAAGSSELDRLLALMSWTVFVEFPLLRELRRSIPGADLGTEGAVWTHPQVIQGRWELALSPELRETSERALRKLLATTDGRALVERAVELVRRRHCWRREIWHEEIMRLESLAPGLADVGERKQARRFFRRVRDTLEDGAGPDMARGLDFQGWVERTLCGPRPRIEGAPLESMEFGPDLKRIRELGWKRRDDEGADTQPPLDPGELTPDASGRWTAPLIMRRDLLSLERPSDHGVSLGQLEGASRWVSVGDQWLALDGAGAVWRLPEHDDEVLVQTTGQRLWLERSEKPKWAERAGYDRYGLWASFEVGGVEQRMRWIPPGRFMMGSPETEEGRWDDEGPQHPVSLTAGYWMADTPCTQALWEAVMGENPSEFSGQRRPVESVSWKDVARFIARLDDTTTSDFGLPTEAQWEYACRAEATGPRYGRLEDIAWYKENTGEETRDVGQKQANAWGLYDMLGNVEEWCSDWWADRYEATAVENPEGPQSGQYRVYRGGGWDDTTRGVRAAFRGWSEPGYRGIYLGFRLVRGQGLRQAGERSESQPATETGTSKGGQVRARDEPGVRPASSQNGKGR